MRLGSVRTFLRFSSVGIIATAAHALTFALLFNTNLTTAQLANFLAYLLAFFFSLFAHSRWSFERSSTGIGGPLFFRFLFVSVGGLLLNSVWVYLAERSFNVTANYALVGIVFVTPLLTYLLLNTWVFREER